MPPEHAPSIFESFNARALKPSEVARTFVPSPNFAKLTQRRHSLVLGPRGSGKTTLLKMLQPAALESWRNPRAPTYCESIEFTGVFIPFDRSWRAQIDALGRSRVVGVDHSVLGVAAFTTHVYRALVAAFISRTSTQAAFREFRRTPLSPQQQAGLSEQLYSCWELPAGPKSLLGVRAALGHRLTMIGALGHRMAVGGNAISAAVIEDKSYLYSSFLEGVGAALDTWEATAGLGEEKWGLLFDELELAPVDIKRALFAALRSRDARLLFKLALSPFDGEFPFESGPEGPQAGQDYDPISLWFSDKRETQPFCRHLWEAMLEEKHTPYVQPKVAFGRSAFETPSNEWTNREPKTAYGPGTRLQRTFAQLESIDPSFRKFLHDRDFDSFRLDRVAPHSRASEIRKVGPLVAARLFFLRGDEGSEGNRSRSRSRKRLTLYAGWESLCAVSEGNPRWFIGLVKPLLDATSGPRLRIPPSRQAVAIEEAAERYRAALRTIPVASSAARRKSSGLLAILDSLGEFFHREQITKAFAAEPPGSFTVDSAVSTELIEAIGQALNAGALVLVDNDEIGGVDGLRGRRLRLCYLLAAHYGMMPRLARAVSISRVLREAEFESRDPVQLSLA